MFPESGSACPAHVPPQGVDEMKVVPPGAGKSSQGDLKGDMVEGINR
jgi:hypothetical protein